LLNRFCIKAGVLGYLLIAVIFREDKVEIKSILTNGTINGSYFNYSGCGANFCPESQLPPSAETELNKVNERGIVSS
jgi:hypothetical protein